MMMQYPFYPNYNQMMLQQQLQNMQQPQNQQIQNGGFISAPSIEFAQNYSVAPGNSVTFKIESQPYICTKTLGFSQLDQPVFEVYRLVKEDSAIKDNTEKETVNKYFTVKEAAEIKDSMNKMQSEIDFLKEYISTNDKGVEDKK